MNLVFLPLRELQEENCCPNLKAVTVALDIAETMGEGDEDSSSVDSACSSSGGPGQTRPNNDPF